MSDTIIYAKDPYVLHLLAGSLTISALDAAKSLLDSGRHNASECEPDENLSVLHVAAAWDNLAMCQLLVHYGADAEARDADGRRPVDVATGRSKKFLKKFRRKRQKDRNKLKKFFSFLFGRSCQQPNNLDASTLISRRSCPILPSAPAHSPPLSPKAKQSIESAYTESRKTSTSSFFTAKESLEKSIALNESVNNAKRTLASTLFEDESKNDSTHFPEEIRDICFSPNVTLRKNRRPSSAKPTNSCLITPESSATANQIDKTQNKRLTRQRASVSCSSEMERCYLSSDHTTPRHSNDDALLYSNDVFASYRQLFNEYTPRNDKKDDRLSSFGQHEKSASLYPHVYADTYDERTHSSKPITTKTRELSAPRNGGGDAQRSDETQAASRHERPYNETLDEVAVGLAVLDIGDEPTTIKAEKESSIREELSSLDIARLKERLRAKKCSVGPINASNRRLYEGKLARIEMNIRNGDANNIAKYSHALRRALMTDDASAIEMGAAEERELRDYFQQPTAVKRREVASFCYLLVDPSMIVDFQRCTFREFVDAIFYVGKGTGSRPFSHLIDAYQIRRIAVPKLSEKVKRILNLWDCGVGVVSLQICQNIHADEALIRECCMIDAIGIENLTNIRRGKITTLRWPQRRVTELGASLLRKAHMIIRNERCRPILEDEVAAMSPYRARRK